MGPFVHSLLIVSDMFLLKFLVKDYVVLCVFVTGPFPSSQEGPRRLLESVQHGVHRSPRFAGSVVSSNFEWRKEQLRALRTRLRSVDLAWIVFVRWRWMYYIWLSLRNATLQRVFVSAAGAELPVVWHWSFEFVCLDVNRVRLVEHSAVVSHVLTSRLWRHCLAHSLPV